MTGRSERVREKRIHGARDENKETKICAAMTKRNCEQGGSTVNSYCPPPLGQ